MRKKKLKRRLAECRDALDHMTRIHPERAGLCMPVPTWREREEAGLPRMEAERGGIRFETPGYAAEERERIDELERQLVVALDGEGTQRARADRLDRELREANRHLEHHHRNGPFTLVREVSDQVGGLNRRLRRGLHDRDDVIVELHAEVARLKEKCGEVEDDEA